MTWREFQPENRAAQRGSESGIILLDEEHEIGARISLERDCSIAPFAVTCGIYGWMVHTRFFSDDAEARAQYALMRDALVPILEGIPYENEPDFQPKWDRTIADIEAFVARFP